MTGTDVRAGVVGASVAGCTAARLYAQRGARVALVERRPDIDAYKTVCTHYIQPSATPTIEKLGLPAPLEESAGPCATRPTCGPRTAVGSAIGGTRRTATTSRARCSIRCCGA